MDEGDRQRYNRVRDRTAADRLDYIDTELRTGVTFAHIAGAHYHFGENFEGRDARSHASHALRNASGAIQTARDYGQSVADLDARAGKLRVALDELYVHDRHGDTDFR